MLNVQLENPSQSYGDATTVDEVFQNLGLRTVRAYGILSGGIFIVPHLL